MKNWKNDVEQLLLFCRDKDKKRLAFVSPHAGSGVSTLTRIFAGLAAQSGYRPILIDMSAPSNGLARENTDARWTVNPVAEWGPSAQPFDVVEVRLQESDKFLVNNTNWLQEKLTYLVGNYDLAVVDLPSIFDRRARTVNPAPILKTCDCVLLVCELGKVTRAEMRRTIDAIEVAGITIDGIVINEGRSPGVGTQIIRFTRRLFWLSPGLASWCEKRIRASTLFE